MPQGCGQCSESKVGQQLGGQCPSPEDGMTGAADTARMEEEAHIGGPWLGGACGQAGSSARVQDGQNGSVRAQSKGAVQCGKTSWKRGHVSMGVPEKNSKG